MILELVGLPGSGKSYLASKVAAGQGLRMVRIGRFGQRYLYVSLFAILHPQLYGRLRSLCREESRGNRMLGRMVLRRLSSAVAKVQKGRLLGGGVIDEGLLQVVLSTYEHSPSGEAVGAILSLIPERGLRIVFVEADAATRNARMIARNKTPREELGAPYVRRWMETQEQTLAILKSACSGRFTSGSIDNSQ